MREALRLQSPRAGRLRSRLISICTSKAPRARSLSPLRAALATDLLLRTTLWMREAPPGLNLCWRELAIVAKALADGRDMAEIGLMRDIAQRTLAVLANDRRR